MTLPVRRSPSNAPSPTTSTARRRDWDALVAAKERVLGLLAESAGRLSPAPSPAASTPAPPLPRLRHPLARRDSGSLAHGAPALPCAPS